MRVWRRSGQPGTPARQFRDGWGLSHIVARRRLDGQDGQFLVTRTLPETLARGVPMRGHGTHSGRRIDIFDGQHVAVLSLRRHGAQER